MQIDILLVFLFSAIVLTVSPGPDIIYVFIKSSSYGYKAGVKTVLGLTSGLFFHTLLLVFGISAIIESSPFIFKSIKFFGSSYFLILAIQLFIIKKNHESKKNLTKNDFFTGLMMNLLNPKVTIFFIAFFPNYIFHDNLSVEIQFTVLGIIFWIIANLIFLIVVFLSSRFGTNFKKYVNSKKIKIVKSIFYLFISVWIML
ncbi:MAG: LysE family translocator [Flavobacteriaceae bacterium]